MNTNFMIPSRSSLHEDERRAWTYPMRSLAPGGICSLEEQIKPATPAKLCKPEEEIPLSTGMQINSKYERKNPSLGISPGGS
jgi:hypothetical protein